MQAIQKYTPFFVSALLMGVVLLLIYPHYQYYIDPDGTAYLTISRRYANGDYQTAINGYWSPWSCWLTALLIKSGLSAIPASVVVNALGAVGFLYIAQSFFLRFKINKKLQWLMNMTLVFFLCYAVFWQSFDDLWECFFLLSVLRIMFAKDFLKMPLLWLLMGFLGALAYFAKAYSFPFFILNTICCTWFLSKDNKARWLMICALSVLTMVAFSFPWICLLHDKYGVWTTSTSGSLNLSWYLVGHPYWKEGIKIMLPPAYPDSPYYWEDPYFANGITPHFWDSFHWFGMQCLRIIYTLFKYIVHSIHISIFLAPFTIFSFFILYSKKIRKHYPADIRMLTLSFLLFPLGYVLVNYESRYIWYMLVPSLIMGLHIIEHVNLHINIPRKAVIYIFLLPYFVYPASRLWVMYDDGAREYEMAQRLKAMNIHGAFTGLTTAGYKTPRMARLAYFSGNPFYSIPGNDTSHVAVLKEMRRYHVNYYFILQPSDERGFTDEHEIAFPEVTNDSIVGLKVYKVNP